MGASWNSPYIGLTAPYEYRRAKWHELEAPAMPYMSVSRSHGRRKTILNA